MSAGASMAEVRRDRGNRPRSRELAQSYANRSCPFVVSNVRFKLRKLTAARSLGLGRWCLRRSLSGL